MRLLIITLFLSATVNAKKSISPEIQKQMDSCIETQTFVANCIREEILPYGDKTCISAFMFYSVAVNTGSCKEEWYPELPKIKDACKKYNCRVNKKTK
ncbi:MAG: hypothetical protein ACXWQQ_02090 [Pseudobdellovibrio sp.]